MFSSKDNDREKLDALHRLAQEQICALEAGDMAAFDQIMASKDAVIASLQNVRGLAAADAGIGAVVRQIQDADAEARHLLLRRTGLLMREMTALRQQKEARQAYQPAGYVLPDTPRFLDQKT